VIGLLLIGLAVATALLVAASTRLPSPVSTLLVAYLAFVADLVLVVLVLSPFREVTQTGLAVAQPIVFASAFAAWWLRGRPSPPLASARLAALQVIREPVTAAFFAVAVLALAYELLIVLTAAPNNWDSMIYHLPRVASWAVHGGFYWIPVVSTDQINEFQPLAEQQILFLFAATGKGALFALPQYMAELAILVAVYGASRRLGFEVRAAACSAFLLATCSVVAMR